MLNRRPFRALTSLSIALIVAGCGGVRAMPGADRVGLAPPAHEARFANIPYAQWTEDEPAYRSIPAMRSRSPSPPRRN